MPIRGRGGIRPGRRLRRGIHSARPSYRGADPRRPAPAASRIWASANAACSGASRRSSRSRRRPALDDGAAAAQIIDAAVRFARSVGYTQSRHVRVSGRCLRSRRRAAVRVHRGQCAAAGRAHGDRGGDRRRSGADPDPAGPGRDACRTGARSSRSRRAAMRSRPASTWRRSAATARSGPAAAR